MIYLRNVSYFSGKHIIDKRIILAFIMEINVNSNHKKRFQQKYRNKNYSGRYRMVEIVNDRPAYKVNFCIHKINIMITLTYRLLVKA